MSQEQDRIFFRNYSIVIGGLFLLIIIFLVAANILGQNPALEAERRGMAVSERTEPVGQVNVASESESTKAAQPQQQQAKAAPQASSKQPTAAADQGAGARKTAATGDGGDINGSQVYNGICTSCHSTGLPGVPQLGDTEEWQKRAEKGMQTLYSNAINGYTGGSGMAMPPKGGNPSLSDAEVKAAVDYMVSSNTE